MLPEYEVLVAVVDHGSLTTAARHLGRSLQAVSRALGALERDVGVQLIRRTTRNLQATPAGLALVGRLRAALAEIEAGRNEAAEHATALSGPLRVGGSGLFAPAYLVPALAAFMQRHSGVTVDLRLDEDYADLVSDRLDFSVRVGKLQDSSLTMRRLGSMRRVTFASPSYLERRGRPACPTDLSRHECIIRTTARDADIWSYAAGGLAESVHVTGKFRASSASACNEAAALGLGIGLALLWQVRSMLDQGRLELVLAGFEPPPTPLSAVWTAGPRLPARARLLIEFLAARFASERW